MVEIDSSGIDLLQQEAVLLNEGQHSFTPPKSYDDVHPSTER